MNRVDPPPPQHKRLPAAPGSTSTRPERRFGGIPVSAGVAIGPVFRASEPTPEITRHKIHAADMRRGRRAARRRHRPVAQAARASCAARLAVLPRGEPGRDRAADRCLYPRCWARRA